MRRQDPSGTGVPEQSRAGLGFGSAWGQGGNPDFHGPCLQGLTASAPALRARSQTGTFLFAARSAFWH